MKLKLLIPILLCFCVPIFGAFSAQIDEEITNALRQFQVPGAAVGVIADGQVVMCKGFGYRDIEQKLPVTEQTSFAIASCTKAFTAHLIDLLVTQGKLTWDDPVVKYLPELSLQQPEVTSQVTLRDLISHRSGIARHDAIWFFNNLNEYGLLPRLAFLEPALPFRQGFHYCNITYAIVALTIEKACGGSWQRLMQQRIFEPLQMRSTHFNSPATSTEFALPYATIDGQLQHVAFMKLAATGAGGGISSTMEDMLKWASWQLKLQATSEIKPDVTLSTPREEGGATFTAYSGGWFIGNYRDQLVLRHNGMVTGFASEIILLPHKGIAVVVLNNNSSQGGFANTCISYTLIDNLLNVEPKNWLELIAKQQQKKKEMEGQTSSFKEPTVATVMSYTPYGGEYWHPAYGRINVGLVNKALTLTFGQAVMPLKEVAPDQFCAFLKQMQAVKMKEELPITFVRDNTGAVTELHIPFEPTVKPIVFTKAGKPSSGQRKDMRVLSLGH